MIKDPINGSTNVQLLKKINSRKLINGYKKMLNIDVEEIVGKEDICLYKSLDTHFEFYYPPKQGNDVFYQKLEDFPWYYAKDKWEHRIGEKLITRGNTLEIGCGSGEFLHKLQKKGISCTGLDFNQNAINEAKKKGLNVVNSTLKEYLKANNDKFDNIILYQILEHIFDINDFFNDLIKLLNHNAQILIAVPNNDSFVFNVLDDSSYVEASSLLNMPPHHAVRWTKKSFQKLAQIFGLKINTIDYEPIYNNRLELVARNIVKKKLPFLQSSKFIERIALNLVKKNRERIHGDTILISFTKV
jgi:2-polyprenyl-3-methyl-5-hydroxy-6-metoxy-1,4-benzoquinol methylase